MEVVPLPYCPENPQVLLCSSTIRLSCLHLSLAAGCPCFCGHGILPFNHLLTTWLTRKDIGACLLSLTFLACSNRDALCSSNVIRVFVSCGVYMCMLTVALLPATSTRWSITRDICYCYPCCTHREAFHDSCHSASVHVLSL